MSDGHRSAFLVISMTFIQGCGGTVPEPAPPPPKNVIIVMVDTLRADHMSTYGYPRLTSPFIDDFAHRSVVFEHARSQSSCTFPSVNSLMTSRYPDVFSHQGEGQFGIPADFPSIAEILDYHGYYTVAVSQSSVVRATPSRYNPNGGFGRGFDRFVEGCVWKHGDCLNRKIFRELRRLESPFFLYLHYMEPHAPYYHPPGHPLRWAGAYQGHDFISAGDPKPIARMIYGDGPDYEISQTDIQHLVDLYDDEIRYFDDIFRQLIGQLESLGLRRQTMVVVTSDHGEEFLEHGQVSHCRGVWNTVTHVPLIINVPNVAGRRLATAVENIDIVPTILDYLDIERVGYGFEGQSLRPFIEGEEIGRRHAFARQMKFRAVDDGRFHLILDTGSERFTLFDIRNDHLEQHDLFEPDHPEVPRLGEGLVRWLELTEERSGLDSTVDADTRKEEELRALGYLE